MWCDGGGVGLFGYFDVWIIDLFEFMFSLVKVSWLG